MKQQTMRLRISRRVLDKPVGGMSLPPSKSIMARELVLEYLRAQLPDYTPEYLDSLPDDCRTLYAALRALVAAETTISVEESGTAMRLMTALIAATAKDPTELSGTARQHQRPIAPLVEALRALGARIEYLAQEGYPPLRIYPSRLRAQTLEVDASMSSQFLSALMLIAPELEGAEGYKLDYAKHGLSSSPYAEMTRQILLSYGVEGQQKQGQISFSKRTLSAPRDPLCERDWSACSYAYELVAIYPEFDGLVLDGVSTPSLQGDAHYVVQYFAALGVDTVQTEMGIRLSRRGVSSLERPWRIDCRACPDLVPALVATALGVGISFCIGGVAHLRLKESDRLSALRDEARALGFVLEVREDSIAWEGGRCSAAECPHVYSHHDHRIAMAMAPLVALISPDGAWVEDAGVVSKSFPRYWAELERLGFGLEFDNDN